MGGDVDGEGGRESKGKDWRGYDIMIQVRNLNVHT